MKKQTKKRVVVTGGAGYIGSHIVIELLKSNYDVIVIDSLERGYKDAIKRTEILSGKKVKFIEVDLKDRGKIHEAFKALNDVSYVIHLAAYKNVGEGEKLPVKYWENNVLATRNLLEEIKEKKIKRIIFSSSCTVYGIPQKLPLDEDCPTIPISVYGKTKLQAEQLIDFYSQEFGIEAISLRYFNAVGCHESGWIGEDSKKSGIFMLVPAVLDCAIGKRNKVYLFGNNFSTKDGTQERDYVDVNDLAVAHRLSLEYKLSKNRMEVFNLSTGKPTSCLEIFKICESVTGKKINIEVTEPRQGDPLVLFAKSVRAKEKLGWSPTVSLETSIRNQWKWVIMNPNGYKE